VEKTLALQPKAVADLREADWPLVLKNVRQYWEQIQKWDRKFLGIRALAELVLVKNLLRGEPIWPVESW